MDMERHNMSKRQSEKEPGDPSNANMLWKIPDNLSFNSQGMSNSIKNEMQKEKPQQKQYEEDKDPVSNSSKRGRKRKRDVEGDLSPKSRRKAQNRIYCRENRRKKKEYITELENTVDKLEGEIVRLNNLIDKYRFKIGVHVIGEEKDFQEYNELQEYRRQHAVKSLQEGKDKKELQRNIKEFSKFAGLASNDRKKLIKAAVRVIIENLVPHRVRILLNLCDTQTNPSFEDIQKLFKCDEKRFQIEVKDPKFSELDRLHYKMKLDPFHHFNLRRKLPLWIKYK